MTKDFIEFTDNRGIRGAMVYNTVSKQGKYKRVYTNVILKINLDAGKPLIVIDDENKTLNTYGKDITPKQTKIDDVGYETFIGDEYYEHINKVERFVLIGKIKNPITKAASMLVYDRKFKDILLIPSVSCFNNYVNMSNRAQTIDIMGSVIGNFREGDNDLFLNENVSNNTDNNTIFPEPIENSVDTVEVLMVQGIDPDTAFKDTNVIENLTDTGKYLIRGESRPKSYIKLGKVSDFLKSAINLPVYLTYNYSPTQTKMLFGGSIDTGDKDIYVEYGM